MNNSFHAGYVLCPSCRSANFLQDQHWKKVCLACWIKSKTKLADALPAPLPLQIELSMLRRLIQLCHPDRHGGSETSKTATQFLLGLKREKP